MTWGMTGSCHIESIASRVSLLSVVRGSPAALISTIRSPCVYTGAHQRESKLQAARQTSSASPCLPGRLDPMTACAWP